MTEPAKSPRREVKARSTGWARRLAAGLSGTGIRPNTISVCSIVFATGAAALLVAAGQKSFPSRTALLLGAAVLIQLRLLCNLFDGMVAVEGGKGTPAGALFNDFPDRVADPLILVGAGYAVQATPHAITLGWLAGLLAVFTAYVRVLAGACHAEQRFLGPMAKQHRMALVTLAILAVAATAQWNDGGLIMIIALSVVCVGCVITAARRLLHASRELDSQ